MEKLECLAKNVARKCRTTNIWKLCNEGGSSVSDARLLNIKEFLDLDEEDRIFS